MPEILSDSTYNLLAVLLSKLEGLEAYDAYLQDMDGDNKRIIEQIAREFKVSYPLLIGLDREDVFNAFGLKDGLPMSLLIRPDGTVADEVIGINTKAWFKEHIEALLAG